MYIYIYMYVYYFVDKFMMTSWHGNTFRMTGFWERNALVIGTARRKFDVFVVYLISCWINMEYYRSLAHHDTHVVLQ